MPPDISVVIPTCRRPAQLREAITSVLSQPEPALELIVVDDSVDESARPIILEFSDPRLRYYLNPKPTGGWVSVVRNLGASHAQAPLVHFLDDDDRAPSGHYAVMKSAFEAHPDVGVVFGRVAPFGDDPSSVQKEQAFFSDAARRAATYSRLGSRWAFSSRMYFDSTLFVCGAAMIRRNCIDPIGGFDVSLKVAEDVDFYARAIERFGGHFIDRDTLHYRIWGSSLMHTPQIQPNLVRDNYRRIHARLRKDHGLLNFMTRKMLARTILRLA